MDSGFWLSVTHVNGRKLAVPVRFGELAVRPVDTTTRNPPYSAGDVWELRGFESGAFTGIPREYYTERKYRDLAFPQGGAFTFVNTFEYFEIKGRKTGDGKRNTSDNGKEPENVSELFFTRPLTRPDSADRGTGWDSRWDSL